MTLLLRLEEKPDWKRAQVIHFKIVGFLRYYLCNTSNFPHFKALLYSVVELQNIKQHNVSSNQKLSLTGNQNIADIS